MLIWGFKQEDWRIQMLPIQFLYFTVRPVIDMRVRCRSQGIDYPPGIPQDITKVVELDMTRLEFQGLDDILKPSELCLGVRGSLYPERCGARSQLKGQVPMSISFALPPVLTLIPEYVCCEVVESVSPSNSITQYYSTWFSWNA